MWRRCWPIPPPGDLQWFAEGHVPSWNKTQTWQFETLVVHLKVSLRCVGRPSSRTLTSRPLCWQQAAALSTRVWSQTLADYSALTPNSSGCVTTKMENQRSSSRGCMGHRDNKCLVLWSVPVWPWRGHRGRGPLQGDGGYGASLTTKCFVKDFQEN